jgi:transposase
VVSGRFRDWSSAWCGGACRGSLARLQPPSALLFLTDAPELRIAIEHLLEVRNMMRKQKVLLDRQLGAIARKDTVYMLLMTIPGVGPIVSLAFKATIDDPNRFKDSRAVAAHLGLTPRIYRSGEIDRRKCGDKMMRRAQYEAANSHLRISKKWSVLRAQGVKLTKRAGSKKACVAISQTGCDHASNVG